MFEHRPFGHHLKLTVRGASHAPAIVFALDGLPAGERLDRAALAAFMARRAPGRDNLSTARREADTVTFMAGLNGDATDGSTLVGRIANTDFRPADYGDERTVPRPGHADFGQWVEHGRIPTGGGPNSGRMTAALCAAGGACLQWLARRGISVTAEIDTIGGRNRDFKATIEAARDAGDSVGGTITCTATGLQPGLGGALFAGLESELAAALFAIPGVKGVSFGNGFDAAALCGSANDDAFDAADGRISTRGNNHGGILGGRTSGMPVVIHIALKPTPTVFKPLDSIDLVTGEKATCRMKGRHDPCIVRRAAPVVEAMVGFVLADLLLATEAAVPRICLTLTGATLDENLAQFNAQRLFTDMVELRIDLLDEAERRHAADFAARLPVPVLLTFRRKADGGNYAGDETARRDFLRTALHSRAFAYVDFEDDLRDDGLTAAAHAADTRIIRSLHDFSGPVTGIVERARALRGNTGEIPKIAFRPNTLDDVTRLFEETRDFTDIPHIFCAMGAIGGVSRTLAVRTHSMLTFASTDGLTALGHRSPRELVRDYRVRTQTKGAALFGVTGWPIAYTRSPELHNAAFSAADEDAVMVALPTPEIAPALRFMKATGMRGMAVTIPHKQAIMDLLDDIDPTARRIGAVNTVACENGRLIGYNTDAAGFATAITAFLGRPDLADLRVAVLGAGGASKAVVATLERLNAATIEVFHRQSLTPGFDVIVNATPVDPIANYAFRGDEAVYDLAYDPPETPLMARARAAGCRVENGFSMLIAQAREQRRIWGMS